MVWEPFALALFVGLVISAGIYFVFVWPRIEPPDQDDDDDEDEDGGVSGNSGAGEEE